MSPVTKSSRYIIPVAVSGPVSATTWFTITWRFEYGPAFTNGSSASPNSRANAD